MGQFLSCDWGTSSFRIRLVDLNDARVLAEETADLGIAETFRRWDTGSGGPEVNKISFYLQVIREYIKLLEQKFYKPLNGLKIILSGMASSSIGFVDIPYNTVPFPVDGSLIKTAMIPSTNSFRHDVLVISGIRTENDVMRGEETQLIGCIKPGDYIENELFLFPGTHSKHVTVTNNLITDFKTYMTGEVFELLSKKSILKNSVEINPFLNHGEHLDHFVNGVKDARQSNLLNAIFKVRTNQLFNINGSAENYDYLSGLIIGYELKDLKFQLANTINLICSNNLVNHYKTALQVLEIENTKFFSPVWADEAVVRGQLQIGKQLKILT